LRVPGYSNQYATCTQQILHHEKKGEKYELTIKKGVAHATPKPKTM